MGFVLVAPDEQGYVVVSQRVVVVHRGHPHIQPVVTLDLEQEELTEGVQAAGGVLTLEVEVITAGAELGAEVVHGTTQVLHVLFLV